MVVIIRRFINISAHSFLMAIEARLDYVPYHGDIRDYFRDIPIDEFLVFNGILKKEHPDNYPPYTDVSDVDAVILKIGTSGTAHKNPKRDQYNMQCISEDMKELKKKVKNLYLVTSGAIGRGRKARLRNGERIPEKEKETPAQKRLDAIVGQPILYEDWKKSFSPLETKEFLITHDDIRYQKKALLRELEDCISSNIVPIINEDDARTIEEIVYEKKGVKIFSDNDWLATILAVFLKDYGYNPMTVFLSNTNGIYTAESFNTGRYEPISIVMNPEGLEKQALPISSPRGRGGMISKIDAGAYGRKNKVGSVFACGQYCNHDSLFQKGVKDAMRKYNVLEAIMEGKYVGTRFLPVDYFLR